MHDIFKCGPFFDSAIIYTRLFIDSIDRLLEGRHFNKIYTREQLQRCQASRECPKALHFTRNILQFSQALLLGSQSDMDDILEAAHKIQRNAGALAKA